MTERRLSSVLFALIFILSSVTVSAEAIAHKVMKGNTLWGLAKRYHTTPAKIAKANGIGENSTLALGKIIKIPSEHAAPNAKAVSKPSRVMGYTIHTNANGVCLRKTPGTGSAKVRVLSIGTTGKVLAIKGRWAKIALSNGACGYVYRPLMAKGRGVVTSTADKTESPTRIASASVPSNTNLIQTALGCRGSRYRRGGTSRGGFDCSGFTRYIFAKYGVSLPHSSAAQARLGTPVSRGSLRSGDLVFFQTYRRGISHVGIYIGNGQFVHAATYGRGVRVDLLGSEYYSRRYRCARRVK